MEAPLSPSSDCHSDIKLSSLCDVQPSPVPASCPSLIVADCQSIGASVTFLNTEAGTVTTQMTAMGKNSTVAVSPTSASVMIHSDGECAVTLLAGCDIASHLNIEDSDADKNPTSNNIDLASSYNEHDLLPASEVQVPCVSNDDIVASATPADRVTVDS